MSRPTSIPVPTDCAAHPPEARPPSPLRWDDLSRNVYCVLGLPIDAIDMPGLVEVIDQAVVRKTPFLISTPNLSFLVQSRSDPEFRDTILLSEICPADGMPLVWVAQLLGLPIKRRVAGSDLLESLKARSPSQQLKLFLFGGSKGVAEAAGTALNKYPGGLMCVGSAYPGFGTVEDMSRDSLIAKINSSHAHFVVVALGAQKGQSWLIRNYDRLTAPIRSHLGASINFAAGAVKRAPKALRKLGLEWIWRIKEEPYLWKRYWRDGSTLLGLLVTHILPLAVLERGTRCYERLFPKLLIEQAADQQKITVILSGTATRRNIDIARASFCDLTAKNKTIRINLAKTSIIDARFLGLLLMLAKQAKKDKAKLAFVDVSYRLRAMFRLHGAGFLLGSE